jgi:UDP-glucose 4-epimerase
MIIVTGGLGFIGNELVRQLKNSGKEVVVLDNKNRVAPRIDDLKSVPIEHLEITDHIAVSDFFKTVKPEVVFHLAAIHYIPECNENPERTLRVNVEGTQSLLRAAASANVKKFVFASSGAVYADSAQNLSETTAIAPVDIYGWSKLFGEQLCELNYSISNMRTVICRLFNNYGPRETNPHIIPEILNQLRSGDSLKLGNISTVRDYIHTSDCALALIKLAELNANGVTTVNIAGGKGYTVSDVIELIRRITGRSIKVNLDQGRLRKFDKQTQVADISKLRSLTGWAPQTTLENGMKDLLTFEGII